MNPELVTFALHNAQGNTTDEEKDCLGSIGVLMGRVLLKSLITSKQGIIRQGYVH